MSLGTTLLLGLIAGSTIVLGMPIGRLRAPAPRVLVLLNAITIGVLLFLLWDVLSAAWEPTDAALAATHDNTGGFGPVLGYGLLFVVGISVGLMSLVGYEQWMRRKVERLRSAQAAPAMAAASVSGSPDEPGAPGAASGDPGASG